MREAIGRFVMVGANGGYCLETVRPMDSRLQLRGEEGVPPHGQCFRLLGEFIDVRCLSLLPNLAHKIAESEHPINEVVVIDETAGVTPNPVALTPPRFHTITESYPPESELISFDIEEEDPADFRKARRCLIEFADPISEETLDRASAVVRSFADLLEAGAMSPPVRPSPAADVWLDTIERFDDASFEMVFSVFDASEESWNVLFNMLDKFSQMVAPIDLVTLT